VKEEEAIHYVDGPKEAKAEERQDGPKIEEVVQVSVS
jgi:hypothetical protein